MRKVGNLERLDDAVESDLRDESEELRTACQGSTEDGNPVRVGAAERDDLDVLQLVPEQEERPERCAHHGLRCLSSRALGRRHAESPEMIADSSAMCLRCLGISSSVTRSWASPLRVPFAASYIFRPASSPSRSSRTDAGSRSSAKAPHLPR